MVDERFNVLPDEEGKETDFEKAINEVVLPPMEWASPAKNDGTPIPIKEFKLFPEIVNDQTESE